MLGIRFLIVLTIGRHGLTFTNTSNPQYSRVLKFLFPRPDPDILELRRTWSSTFFWCWLPNNMLLVKPYFNCVFPMLAVFNSTTWKYEISKICEAIHVGLLKQKEFQGVVQAQDLRCSRMVCIVILSPLSMIRFRHEARLLFSSGYHQPCGQWERGADNPERCRRCVHNPPSRSGF